MLTTEVITLTLQRHDKAMPIGIDLTRSADGRWILLADLKKESPLARYRHLRPGA